MKLRWFRSAFQKRLFLTISLLLLAAMVVAGAAVSVITTERVRGAMQERLQVGQGVLAAQLRSRAEQLENSVRVLTSDFGFIAAVATGDEATVTSALSNHGERIGANFLLLTDIEGQFLTASNSELEFAGAVPFAEVLAKADSTGQAYSVVAFQGGIYQLFLRSVKAPNPVAWVYMGFALDANEAQRVSDLTQLEVSFVGVAGADERISVVSTLPNSSLTATLASLGAVGYPNHGVATALDDRFLTVTKSLTTLSDHTLFAMLQTPVTELTETRAALLWQLALIALVTLFFGMLVSGWLAGQLARPIELLIRGAKRIHQGDYTEPVAVQGHGDLALLGDALNTMVSGIEDREQRIRALAYHDSTTGAPNKLAFTEKYDLKLDAAVPPEPAATDRQASDAELRADGFALCLFSLVNAREISFNLGFENGEELMRAAVQGLREEIREQDDLYAFRADQYALVLPGLTAAAARERVGCLVDRMNRSYVLDEWTVTGQAAAAIVGYPDDADDLQTLLRRAEVTLDQAINAEHNTEVYVAGQEDTVARRLRIIGAFDAALANGQFSMVFQPKIDIARNEVSDCEALLRWIHPEIGFIPPDEFILLAEQSGKMHGITDFVLETAIAQAVPWYNTFGVRVAINLSARDIGDPELDIRVRETMARYGASGDMITLEVTESAVLDDKDAATAMLQKLRVLGVRLSIDDYGTGYSSLAQLKHLPVHELKIDKAFVLEMDACAEDAMIVKSTIELGHNMQLSVVAEGVENEESLDLLRQYGCDKAQGYFFAKPMPALEFEQWCTSFRERNPKLLENHG